MGLSSDYQEVSGCSHCPQMKFVKVMYVWVGEGLCPGGVSLSRRGILSRRGVSVQDGASVQGVFCPEGLCPGESFSRGVSVQGVSVQGGLSLVGVSDRETFLQLYAGGKHPNEMHSC